MVTDDDRVIKLKDEVAAEIFTSMSDNLLEKKRSVAIAAKTLYFLVGIWFLTYFLHAPGIIRNTVFVLELAAAAIWLIENYSYKIQMSIYANAILTARLTQNVEKKANG